MNGFWVSGLPKRIDRGCYLLSKRMLDRTCLLRGVPGVSFSFTWLSVYGALI